MAKTKRSAEACEAAETEEFGGSDDSLQIMLAKPVKARSRVGQPEGSEQPAKIDGVAIGRLVEAVGPLLVDFPGNPSSSPLPARAAAQILPEDSGAEVALLFENGNPLKPIIVGKMFSGSELSFDDRPSSGSEAGREAALDGERVTLSAEKEIVLRCGKASITLTRAGKIIIKGAYLLNRSTGVNRIKGGSVQIN